MSELSKHPELKRHPETMHAAETLRREIAKRRDGLVARQRKAYSSKRQELIEELAEDYDRVLEIALRAGAEG